MLSLQNKADIYDLLKQGFQEEKKIPLATVAMYLNSKKFSYQEYGYKKLISLLSDCSFLTCQPDVKNHSIVYVTLHPFKDEKETTPKKAKSSKPKLDEKNKKKISQLLLSQYLPGETYPLSGVSKYLVDNKIDYKALGFSKLRKLLETLTDILYLEEDENDSSILNVTFLKLKKKTPNAEKKKEEKVKTATSHLPEPKKGCFFVPNNLILSIKEFTSLGLDNDSIISLLLKDYTTAYKEKSFKPKDDAFIFPLSFQSKENEALIASIKKAGKGATYAYYLNFVGSDKEKAKDCLDDHIRFNDYEGAMAELAKLARKEKWCYHNSKDKYIILKIYLQYTFYQVFSQNKLMEDKASSFACFNTGLKTESYEDIYAILQKSSDKSIPQPYIFQGFSTAGSQGLGKIVVEHFNPLPLKASYLTSNNDLIFNANSDIHTDYHHIILDNLDRFPIDFLKTLVRPFKEENRLLEQIEKEKSAFTRDKLFSKLEKLVEKNDNLFTYLRISLEASISKAIRMVNYDYRNALPSFFPTRNVMSLMLPLEFSNNDEVQAVLLIERTPSGNYQGQTILTLKQCYVNARLISPLENSFLNPSKIED